MRTKKCSVEHMCTSGFALQLAWLLQVPNLDAAASNWTPSDQNVHKSHLMQCFALHNNCPSLAAQEKCTCCSVVHI
jgi:hypothetical protein